MWGLCHLSWRAYVIFHGGPMSSSMADLCHLPYRTYVIFHGGPMSSSMASLCHLPRRAYVIFHGGPRVVPPPLPCSVQARPALTLRP